MRGSGQSLGERVREFALNFPEAWIDEPWPGDEVVKVGKKIFVFMGAVGGPRPSIGIKLTDSHEAAMSFPEVHPSGYGLGRHGWVVVPLGGSVPAEVILDWVEEGYRAVATKTLVKRLDAEAGRQSHT